MRRPSAILLVLFALLAGCIILTQRVPSRVAYDQKLYHVPSIQQFADALPTFDPWDYLSATTPGYHLLYALVYRASGGSLLALQLLSTLVAGGFFWLLATLVTNSLARGTPAAPDAAPPRSLARSLAGSCACSLPLCLPLLTSPYTLYPAVFILPDMLGWLCVLGLLAIALRDRITLPLLAIASAVLVALVLTRQIHIWVAGPLVLACLLQSSAFHAASPTIRSLVRSLARSLFAPRALASAALITLPAVITLALFVRYWGGLVPPRFQGWYPTRTLLDMALSPAPTFFLTMTGIYGCFFAGYLLEPARALWHKHRAWLFAALTLGALIAIVPATTYDYDAGRRTGIWNIAARLPVIAGHTSPLLLAGSMWGALVFATLLSAQALRRSLILCCAAAAYCAAMSASVETWQRYFDPMVLMLLALLCAGATITPLAGVSQMERVARIAGPTLLALLLLVQSTLPFLRADATTMHAPPPPAKSENHQGGEPPVLFAPPVKPANRVFWPL